MTKLIIIIILIIIVIIFFSKNMLKDIERFAEPGLPDCTINNTKETCNGIEQCIWYNEEGYRPLCQLKVLPNKYKMLYNCVIQPTEWACKGLPACSWFEKDLKRVCVLKDFPNK